MRQCLGFSVCVLSQTLWDPMDCSLPGSTVRGVLQARIPEWVAISFSRGYSWPRDRTCVFHIGRWILYHWATKVKWSRSVVSDSLWPHGLQPTRLLPPWDSPGKSIGVGCHFLLWATREAQMRLWARINLPKMKINLKLFQNSISLSDPLSPSTKCQTCD